MSIQTRRELFGGAFRCAGLAAAALAAQSATADMAPAYAGLPNYTMMFAKNLAGDFVVSGYNSAYTAWTPPPLSYAGPGGNLYAYVGATQLMVSVTHDDDSVWSLCGGGVMFAFTVDHPTQALIEWDFTHSTDSAVTFYDSDTGLPLLAQFQGTAGSASWTLLPGNVYRFQGRTLQGLLGETAFASLTLVPAPGAFALLGLGALTTRRRRRSS